MGQILSFVNYVRRILTFTSKSKAIGDIEKIDAGTSNACILKKKMCTHNGVITIKLSDEILVDITVNKRVRIINEINRLQLCFMRSSCFIIHSRGRLHQSDKNIDIVIENIYNRRYIKMTAEGVSFSSDKSNLAYMLEAEGGKCVIREDTFSALNLDYMYNIFGFTEKLGREYQEEAVSIAERARCWQNDDSDHYLINGVNITHTRDGLVLITKSEGAYEIRMHAEKESALLKTPNFFSRVKVEEDGYIFFAKQGEKRMHSDNSIVLLHCGNNDRGLDNNGKLIV